MTKLMIRVIAAFLAVTTVFCGCSSCEEASEPEVKKDFKFSVYYIDVGEGDASFLKMPDGKNILIDCGRADYKGNNIANIKKVLDENEVKTIDCFILTHEDEYHIGNASAIAESYSVKTAYIPKIYDKSKHRAIDLATSALEKSGAEIKVSAIYEKLSGENWKLLFLSPQPPDWSSGFYDRFNLADASDTDINNVSPIIYLECFGIRFLFTGDAESEPQRFVLENDIIGLYKEENVQIKGADFFTLPNHGSSDGVYEEFWEYVDCKNAIISSGADNGFSHPSDVALSALEKLCGDYELYRTDTCGTICVKGDGKDYQVFTEAN